MTYSDIDVVAEPSTSAAGRSGPGTTTAPARSPRHQAVRVTGGSRAVFAGCYLQGRHRGWQADGSSSIICDTTTWAKGPTSAPVIVAGPPDA